MAHELATIDSEIGRRIGELWVALETNDLGDEYTAGGQSVKELERIEALEAGLSTAESLDITTFHEFMDGIYIRGIRAPKDAVLIGRMHRHDCLNFMERGKVATIVNGEVRIFEAGYFGKSGPMTRKASVVIEDMTWVTVHSNPDNEKSVAILEERLFIPSRTFLTHDSTREI